MPAPRSLHIATFAVLAACGHGEAFQAGEPWAVGQLQPGTTARLTYSRGRDQAASWGGRGGILYTFEDQADPVRRWCLGLLPDSGGSRTRTWCRASPPESVAVYYEAAQSSDGAMAYVQASSPRSAAAPSDWALLVNAGGEPAGGTRLASIPFTMAGLPMVQAVEQVRWLSPSSLVYLADRHFVGARCRGCPVDTVSAGRMVLRQSVEPPGQPELLPGTDYATSVAVRGGDEVFFTRGGDTRVWRLAVPSGVVTAVWDAGALGVARDVQVAGTRLLAVVGGQVAFGYDSALADSAQADGGGDLLVADLVAGSWQVLQLPFPVRRPALSADGRRAVVETAARPADLWLVELP